MIFLPEPLHKIAVVGVGCCGRNAINYIQQDLENDVDLWVFDTDSRGMESDEYVKRIAIGQEITQGLSAGSIPEQGQAAAQQSLELINQSLSGYDIIFVTGGLGGGTATGVIPVLTEFLKHLDVIVVTIVTTPFGFEGRKKTEYANQAISLINASSDSTISVSNQKLLTTMPKSSTLLSAFEASNQVLKNSLLGIYSLISTTGYINLDFADVRTVLSNAGPTVIGYGQGTGEHRVVQAVDSALNNPLINDFDLACSTALLINITADYSLTLEEIHQAGELLTNKTQNDIPIIIGTVVHDTIQDDVKIYAIFSGVETKPFLELVHDVGEQA
ncbi:cell division protein FtsZ [Vibrio breoganii]